jgi:hypothetical protein
VNAAVALRFVQYRFERLPAISHAGSISASERVVLRRFFGIEAAEMDENTDAIEPQVDWAAPPQAVVPLERPLQSFAPARAKSNRKPVLLAVCVAVLLGLALGAIAFKARIKTSPRTESVAILADTPPQLSAVSKPEVKQTAAAVDMTAQTKRENNVPDLSGEWRVTNTVQKTAFKSFDNMEVGFRLSITQTGKEFTAKGEKLSENGKTLPAASRTPIHVTGTIDGDRVLATFVEDGKMRQTNGRFVWKLNNDRLAGTFVSTAANSSGTSAVIKQ